MRRVFCLALISFLLLVPVSAEAQSLASAGQIYVITHVDFTPKNAPAGEKVLLGYAADSRKEVGALRFEVLQEAAQANHFILIEIWRDRVAYDAHLGTTATIQFRDVLQPLIGAPFDVRLARLDQ